MKMIYKYDLSQRKAVDGFTTCNVTMPHGANVLTIQLQHGNYVLWAEVDPVRACKTYNFIIVNTENPIPSSNYKYVTTVQTASGAIVRHFYLRV